MAVKSLYFKNVTANGALALQDGGTAPATGITTTGWTVAKLATPNFSRMAVGTKSTTFAATDPMATASFTAGSCWRSENQFTGNFANTSWTLAFRVRAVSSSSSQTGAVKVRVWKSTAADGTGATEVTSALLTGTTTAVLSTTVSATSTVTWASPGIKTFVNEYLWVQCEWSVVATGGANGCDSVFFIESTGLVTTPDFVATITGTGALSSGPATMAGAGLGLSTGTGGLAAASATTIPSSGLGRSTGTAALASPVSAISGVGTVTTVALLRAVVSWVELSGVELLLVTGTGALAAQNSTLAGTGTVTTVGGGIAGTGALVVSGVAVTNYALQSETLDYGTPVWFTDASNVTANAAIAPNGTTTAERITDTVATSYHYILQQIVSITAGVPFTYSIYAKAETLSWLQIYLTNGSILANFNLATGVVGDTNGSVVPQIVAVGDGWYRCSITRTMPSGSATNIYFLLSNSNSTGLAYYAGTGSGSLLLWGMQVEQGSTPTAYIPTTTVAVTVTASSLSGSGAVSAGGITGTGATVYTSLEINGSIGSLSFGLSGLQRTSQTFIAIAPKLTGVGVWLSTSGTPSDGVRGRLYTVDASHNPATLLATSNTIPSSILDANPIIWSLNFALSPPTITIGTEYVIVIERSGALDDNNYYFLNWTNDVYAGGELRFYDSANWQSLGGDLITTLNFSTPGGLNAGTSVLVGSGAVSAGIITGTGVLAALPSKRSNFCLQSQTIDSHPPWDLYNVTIGSNAIAAPDGTTTADSIIEDTANTNHFVLQEGIQSSSAATVHTVSMHAKAGTCSWVKLYSYAELTDRWVNFNLTTGTIGQASHTGMSPVMTALGNGWYRCSFVYTPSFSSVHQVGVFIANGDTGVAAYPGAGLNAYVWGVQLERGSVVNGYLPTTTTAVSVDIGLAGSGAVSGLGIITGTAGGTSDLVIHGATDPNVLGTGSIGQTFIATGTSISKVKLYLDHSGSSAGDVRVTLNTVNAGHMPLTEIGSASVVLSSVPATKTLVEFTFSSPVAVTSGTEYAITATRTAAQVDGSDILHFYISSASIYAGGQFVYNGGSWISVGPYDLDCIISFVADGGLLSSSSTLVGTGAVSDVAGVTGTGALVATLPSGATNLASQSETLDVTPRWATNAATVTANVATLAPNGTATAEQLTDTTDFLQHYLYQLAIHTTAGLPYTFSVYAKAGTLSWFQIYSSNIFGQANFNLTTGVIGNRTDGITPQMVAVGGGWYRCSITYTAATGADTNLVFVLSNGDTLGLAGYTGTGTGSILLWGVQAELGTVPTAYVPTTTVPVTGSYSHITGSGSVSGAVAQRTYVKVSGVWQPATTSVKDAGVWKVPDKVYVKAGGVWKEV